MLTTTGHIFGKIHEQGGSWGLEQTADGKPRFFVSAGLHAVHEFISTESLQLNQWNHTAATYNAETGRLEPRGLRRVAGQLRQHSVVDLHNHEWC